MTPQANNQATPPIDTAPVAPLFALSQTKGSFGQFRIVNRSENRLPEKKPAEMAISDFYKRHEYKVLMHQCIHWVNAVSILKTGNLAPFGSYKEQQSGFARHPNTRSVYFWAEHREQSPNCVKFHSVDWSHFASEGLQGDLDIITFIHDLSLLDNHYFFTGSTYGIPTEKTFSTVPSIPCAAPLTSDVLDHEILVQGKVPNHSLTAIWVHPSRRDDFLARFQQEGIDSVDGLPLATLINPCELLPCRQAAVRPCNEALPNMGIRTGQNLSVTRH